MNTRIILVKDPILKNYLQYFIFFDHDGKDMFRYSTFPNTNLCLALYKQNNITFIKDRKENNCIITAAKNAYSSRLIGFHNQPFNVNINSELEQICILFHPAGLKAFSKIPYHELTGHSSAFEQLFPNQYYLEQLFDTPAPEAKADLLEAFFLKHLLDNQIDNRIVAAMKVIHYSKGVISISALADRMAMDVSTLYRKFSAQIGQGPKEFLQTVRFRNVLTDIISGQYVHSSNVSSRDSFFDQSHFIKNFKKRSGQLPHVLQRRITVEQQQLAWVTTGQ